MQHRKAALGPAHKANGVGVGEGGGDDALFVGKALDSAQSVAQLGGPLKAQFFRRLFHLSAQIFDQLPALAVEDQGSLHHAAAVILRVAVAEAPAGACAHVIVETGPLFADIPRKLAGAVRQQQGFGDRGDDVPRLAPAAEGAEVFCPVLASAALDRHGRVFLPHIEADKRIALVVLEQDVVMGFVPLDERIFQYQSFKLAACDNDVEVPHLIHHGGNLGKMFSMEITRDTVLELFGFADIDNLALLVEHDVHARQQRQPVCLVG